MSSQPRAIITGVTGQDGAYLAQLLVEKGYDVVGWHSPTRPLQDWRLRELGLNLQLEAVELADAAQVSARVQALQPQEIYHLAARSSVVEGQKAPLDYAQAENLLAVHLLEAVRLHSPHTHFLFASSAEVFGACTESPQNEDTPMRPTTVYGCCKAFGQNMVHAYRREFGLFACSAILFNHESPLRGQQFVTRKIVDAFRRFAQGHREPLVLGSLDATRDWGSAPEYVDAMHRILNFSRPEDFVLATGKATSVRSFVEMTAQAVGIQILWQKNDDSEEGVDSVTGQTLVRTTAELLRTSEATVRLGDGGKARHLLGWIPNTTVGELARWMVGA